MFPVIPLFPEQASTLAPEIDKLFFYLVAISIFFSILIFSVITFFAFKYKRKSEDERPKAIHGNNLLEAIWTAIPLAIAMSIFFWGASLFVKTMSSPPSDALEIFVVGKQWMWKIQHPEGPREINELHVPANRPVKLILTSEDVIHSFYIPAFRIKMDALPGRYTTVWFEASKPGKYHLFCAEYCGTKHAGMIGSVIVLEESEYQEWLSGGSASSISGEDMVSQGSRLFNELRCVTCHHDGEAAVGANLDGLYGSKVHLTDGRTVTADEAYLRESILKPTAAIVKGFDPVMPTFEGQVDEGQIMAIIEYLKSKDGGKEHE